ncbi:MAG: c-type cytochrome, partial [Methylococcales bacterium]|nr:c-type cytochrome [Methylococcales bacterium]
KALAVELARVSGVAMDEATMRKQVADATLAPAVRVAMLDSIAPLKDSSDDSLIQGFLSDKTPSVRASAIRHAFARKLDGVKNIAAEEIKNGKLLPARAAIAGSDPTVLLPLWNTRDKGLRKELLLDVYLALTNAKNPDVASWSTAKMGNPQSLTEQGGDPARGELVFRNHGGCMQCHKIGNEGGMQGPELTDIHKRLGKDKILESLINPNAVIAEGYGMSSVKLKNGTSTMGRIAKKTDAEILLIAIDGKETKIKTSDVTEITPPVSAMPPMGLALPLPDLRDLVAYIASAEKSIKAEGESHGESEAEQTAK